MKLTDQSPMPFGTHKDKKMEDVPADYLLWLWDNGAHGVLGPVHDYIRENFSALETECPDRIIEHRP